jgi:hypothetical protein
MLLPYVILPQVTAVTALCNTLCNKCAPGFFRSGTDCLACSRNSFRAASDVETDCTTCASVALLDPRMETLDAAAASASSCVCPSNTFERSYDTRRACFNCNASETCATDTQLTEIDISYGYWRQNARTAGKYS